MRRCCDSFTPGARPRALSLRAACACQRKRPWADSRAPRRPGVCPELPAAWARPPSRLPAREIACRLGSSTIKVASPGPQAPVLFQRAPGHCTCAARHSQQGPAATGAQEQRLELCRGSTCFLFPRTLMLPCCSLCAARLLRAVSTKDPSSLLFGLDTRTHWLQAYSPVVIDCK